MKYRDWGLNYRQKIACRESGLAEIVVGVTVCNVLSIVLGVIMNTILFYGSRSCTFYEMM